MRQIGEVLQVSGVNPERQSGLCYVYAIGPSDGPYKIGVSVDLNERLKTLQTYSPSRLKIHYALPADRDSSYKIERFCHRLLAPKRMAGEWFSAGGDAVLAAMQGAAKCIASDADGNSQSLIGGTTRLVIYVDDETKADFAQSAVDRNLSMQDVLSEALDLYQEKYPPSSRCLPRAVTSEK